MQDERRSGGGEWAWILGIGAVVCIVGAAAVGAYLWLGAHAAPPPTPGPVSRAGSHGGPSLDLDVKLVDFTRDAAGRGRIRLAITPRAGAVEWTELRSGDAKVWSPESEGTAVLGRVIGAPPQSNAGPFTFELETDAIPAQWTAPTLKLVLHARRDTMTTRGSYDWFENIPLHAQEGTDGATPPAIPGAATESALPR